MPQLNYFNDNSAAAEGDITPSFAALKHKSVGPTELMDKTLDEYLNQHPTECLVMHKAEQPGPSELMDRPLTAYITLTPEGEKLHGIKRDHDSVNHPSHYTQGGIECIEAIKASMTHEEFCGYLKGCAQKYLWRYKHKGNPVEDLKKASWYLDRLIKEEESK